MTQQVPSWDLKDVNPNHNIFKLDYEVAELTWENGQLALHELSSRRVPSKSQPTTQWDQPRAAETLEALVNQATLQPPSYKTTNTPLKDVDNDLVPWMHHHNPTVAVNNTNESATMTFDALVPNKTDAGCSTHFSSCSGNPSAFMGTQVARGDNLGGQRLVSASTESPENTSSGRDCSNSTFPDHTTASHRRTSQWETKAVNDKGKSSALINKRRRTAAIHNQSERKRRDKINQKLKTLQKLVPNSSKTDKASMLDEVIEHIRQLQVQLHAVNMMNISPMMMSLIMQQQQQLQLQKSMMNTMGMGMGMGMGMTGLGMGIGGMDMNTIQARFHPSAFMQMPSWNNQTADQVNANTPAVSPMPPFLASRSTSLNMESYSRMAALYQQMQNQPCGPFPKN